MNYTKTQRLIIGFGGLLPFVVIVAMLWSILLILTTLPIVPSLIFVAIVIAPFVAGGIFLAKIGIYLLINAILGHEDWDFS